MLGGLQLNDLPCIFYANLSNILHYDTSLFMHWTTSCPLAPLMSLLNYNLFNLLTSTFNNHQIKVNSQIHAHVYVNIHFKLSGYHNYNPTCTLLRSYKALCRMPLLQCTSDHQNRSFEVAEENAISWVWQLI